MASGFVAVIGNSHINAIRRAAERAGESRVRFLDLKADPQACIDTAEFRDADMHFFSVAGNMHHHIGLLNDPVPFDFDIDAETAGPLSRLCGRIIEERETIPFHQMKQIMATRMEPFFHRPLEILAQASPASRFLLQSPPPVGNEARIRAYPGFFFKDKLAELGVAPRSTRLKLWLLHSLCAREACDRFGLTFVEVPPQAVNPGGFIREAFSAGTDHVHGNERYGAAVLAQVLALASRRGP
jgi:hypothetical protein